MKKLALSFLMGVMMSSAIFADEKITLAGGCFWCVEGVYSQTKGVKSAISGYANGQTPNPTYKAVCAGTTGYAEAVEVVYDPKIISLEKILEIFWHIHDPTTLNRQGADAGTQYRSGIFYSNQKDKQKIKASKEAAQKSFSDSIVTQIEPLKNWYKAEEYHQNYFAKNPSQGYCQAVVAPKVEKFKKGFLEFAK